MKLTSYSRASFLAISTLAAIWAAGCSDDDPAGTEGTGGGTDVATGGKATTGVGGKAAGVGGKAAGVGGVGVGGTTTGVGGTNAAGDTGTPSVGGAGVGGAGVGGAGVGGTVTAGAGGTTTATGGTSSSAGTAGQAPGSAGAAGAGCGTTPSTVSQTWAFIGPTLPTGWKAASSATVTFVTAPAICAAGCAAFAFTIPAGTNWGGASAINYQFASLANLYGATLTATVALELPAANVAGTSLQIFDQGGGTSGWDWGTSTDMPQAQRGVTTQLFPLELKPTANATNGHCASTVISIGLQVQRSATAAADYSGILYISEFKITPPGGSTGAGGASGTAGAPNTGTAGASTAGAGGTTGAAGAAVVAGNAGTAGAN